jgi:ferredoxin
MPLTPADIVEQAHALEADLVGFASWHDLEPGAPAHDKPMKHSTLMKTVIVLARRILTGVAACPNPALQQYDLGRGLGLLEETASKLAYWLESHRQLAVVLSTLVPDTRSQPPGFASPAGQGSMLIRQAAVMAGMGSLGLNTMLLTPQYGPRVFLMGVLTDFEVEPASPYTGELCPGALECGRCARACPVNAIPDAQGPLHAVRGLNAAACAARCQPQGPEALVSFLHGIAITPQHARAAHVEASGEAQPLFHGVTVLRHGAFTGCMRCELACPVGEDYAKLEQHLAATGQQPA